MANINLHQLLKVMIDSGATDLHITTDSPPQLRIDGSMRRLKTDPLSAIDTKQLCYSILSDKQKKQLEEELEIDLSFGVQSLARFRANLYMQRGAVAGAFRIIPFQIPEFNDLGLPEVVRRIAQKPRGLILVTGPTGSGKSTTLAAVINLINQTTPGHIITIEDPIEYLHTHQNCVVNQREVGSDTAGFSRALKSILRQDPDVVLIGELRDLETIEAALTIAETGHLTFATLHTNSCVQTINRIIDVFPPHQQSQVRAQLSFVLEGVICQSLIPLKTGKGRALAMEIMTPNDAIRNLIREDKLHQVYSQMQVGQGTHGMQTFNQSLADLVFGGKISREIAIERSGNPDELTNLLDQGNAPSQLRRGMGRR